MLAYHHMVSLLVQLTRSVKWSSCLRRAPLVSVLALFPAVVAALPAVVVALPAAIVALPAVVVALPAVVVALPAFVAFLVLVVLPAPGRFLLGDRGAGVPALILQEALGNS